MAFVSIDKFLPYVLPYAEHCPDLVARRAVRDTIIDIANRTRSSTMRVQMTSKAGVGEYAMELPHGLAVKMVEQAKHGNFLLKATNRDMLGQLYPASDWHSLVGQPRFYLHTDTPDCLRLVPAPDTDGVPITVELNVTFTREMDEFPEEYYQKHVELVAAGALVRVLTMSGQRFTDLAMASQWQRIYAEGINELLVETHRDFTKESGRVAYRNIL